MSVKNVYSALHFINSYLHDPFIQLHDATDSNEERVRIYRCLGQGKTEELTSRCLEFSLSVSLPIIMITDDISGNMNHQA